MPDKLQLQLLFTGIESQPVQPTHKIFLKHLSASQAGANDFNVFSYLLFCYFYDALHGHHFYVLK